MTEKAEVPASTFIQGRGSALQKVERFVPGEFRKTAG